MISREKGVFDKLKSFKTKFYVNFMIRWGIITLSGLGLFYLIASGLEFSLRLNSIFRAFLLFSFILLAVLSLYLFLIQPVLKILNGRKGLSDEEAAKRIGRFFPSISDRLLNLIQLKKLSRGESLLLEASIRQKSKEVGTVNFAEAVDLRDNLKYLRYLLPILIVLFMLFSINPSIFLESTPRIIQFNQEFAPVAPFEFQILNQELVAFKNEDYTLELQLKGDALPENVYLIDGKRRIKMIAAEAGAFNYTFRKVQSPKKFQFEASGFNSNRYTLELLNRPNIKNFNVSLNFPRYLGKTNQRLTNVGNIEIPEGTVVAWQFQTVHTDSAFVSFNSVDTSFSLQSSDNQIFTFNKQIFKSDKYKLDLKNRHSANKEDILYNISVVPDQYPKISLQVFQDTTLFSYIVLGGNVSDDYGVTQLRLFYQSGEEDFKGLNVPVSSGQTNQSFYYQWRFDSLKLKDGESLRYYLQVWDNDGVNGRKSVKTGVYQLKTPTKKEIKEKLENASSKTQHKINKTLEEAKELEEKIKEAEERLKGKKDLNWQDKNLLKDILKKKEELNQALEELKELNKNNDQRRDRFNEQNENIREKVEQLQQLMEELLDEETKKLYDELQKLLEENLNIEDVQDLLEQLSDKEDNLEKELERTLELFKRMKFEYELNETVEELQEIAKEQEELAEESQDKSNSEGELTETQEELEQDFQDFKESLDELDELNQELQNPEPMPQNQESMDEVEQQQQMSKEMLNKGKRKKAGESQKKAAEEMKKMAESMEQMQSSMEMSMMMENLDHLRDIVHNLLKLSFDQENLMKEFRDVKQSDPRFIELSQNQLKLKDDAKIVEDSLISLSKRVFQIASFVTREVGDMNNHMDNSVSAIRERKKPLALSEQQFAMTSMNNLALLLDDVMKQMQDALADAMGKPKPGEGKEPVPSLGELQKQLNQKISQLKRSGKSGKQLSEELAKLAAEQERIRKALEEMQEKFREDKNGEGGQKPGDGIPEKMEETEVDLVNKKITRETLRRQEEILTRLLEAENALRERELDEERKGETATEYEKEIPKAFEEYFKLKEKEIELLKTIPPKLYPYYKQEVNEYFKRLGKNQINQN